MFVKNFSETMLNQKLILSVIALNYSQSTQLTSEIYVKVLLKKVCFGLTISNYLFIINCN